MSLPGPAPCELLPWDTQFFRCRIARVCGDALNPERAVQIDDWSRRNRVKCLYFLSRADDPATIETAERHGFRLVDIRITFERKSLRPPDLAHSGTPASMGIRPVQPSDLSALQAIARTAHGTTRFFSDSRFPCQRVEELYSTWIALDIQSRAQAVFVAAAGSGQPMGYISCHLDSGHGHGSIGLVGVRSEVRGRGIGKSLVGAAIDWFGTNEAREVTVVTQGNNRAAQRLYQRCGFLSRDLQLWFHKWYLQPD